MALVAETTPVALASDRRSSNLGSATRSEIVLLLPEV